MAEFIESKNVSEKKQLFHKHVVNLQQRITDELFKLDPEIKLTEDIWKRQDHIGEEGGGGITRAFAGKLIENAGVNTSMVYGEISPEFAKSLNGGSTKLWAAGISLIIHPSNPKVPTTHANFRMIQNGDKIWFGGGADLTPFYPNEEDFTNYHNHWKKILAPYGVYEDMKKTCDTYFTNTHRAGEMRGIGGFFYDHYNSGDLEKDFAFVTDISEGFIPSYFPLCDLRKGESFTEEDEDFMLHRRGRYVEFNLLHDRGTMFGLKTNGRTDSILISLPGRCKFTYQYRPKAGSVHEKMLEYYYPRNWATI
jgi:coproporphyrinogen III oxidase